MRPNITFAKATILFSLPIVETTAIGFWQTMTLLKQMGDYSVVGAEYLVANSYRIKSHTETTLTLTSISMMGNLRGQRKLLAQLPPTPVGVQSKLSMAGAAANVMAYCETHRSWGKVAAEIWKYKLETPPAAFYILHTGISTLPDEYEAKLHNGTYFSHFPYLRINNAE